MDIRFISSLTAEDESVFAPALLKAVGALLDQLPIAYTIRIETTGAQIFQHTHAATEATPLSPPSPAASAHTTRILAGTNGEEPVRHRQLSPARELIL